MKGVLLVQLGTPDAPTPSAVGRFLAEFLTDGRVVQLPWLLRQLLVRGIIVPFRRKQSAHAYQQIWTDQGSPLRWHTTHLCDEVQRVLHGKASVTVAMRYGSPSIAEALTALCEQGCDELVILPLFPQYAAATTASVLEQVMSFFGERVNVPSIQWVHAFYDHPAFVRAWVERISASLGAQPIDHVLFSYHGLPVAQVQASETGDVHCDQVAPCPAMGEANRFCYRAQCYATTQAIIDAMPAPPPHSVSFQSRLGRLPWIQPYTEEALNSLHASGVRHLAVVSPAFVSDCLETLEELGIRAQADWLALGGKSFQLVPSLNATPAWVQAVAGMVE